MNDKAFKQLVQSYMKQGYDINQATSLAQGQPADGPAKPPQQPKAPRPVQDTTPRRLVDDQDSGNLKIKKKSKRRRLEQSRGTGQLRINREGSMNLGAGTPAASGGVNI